MKIGENTLPDGAVISIVEIRGSREEWSHFQSLDKETTYIPRISGEADICDSFCRMSPQKKTATQH